MEVLEKGGHQLESGRLHTEGRHLERRAPGPTCRGQRPCVTNREPLAGSLSKSWKSRDESPAFGAVSGLRAPTLGLSWLLEARPVLTILCPAVWPRSAAAPAEPRGQWALPKQPRVVSEAASDELFQEKGIYDSFVYRASTCGR